MWKNKLKIKNLSCGKFKLLPNLSFPKFKCKIVFKLKKGCLFNTLLLFWTCPKSNAPLKRVEPRKFCPSLGKLKNMMVMVIYIIVAPTSLHLSLHTTPMVFLLLLFVEASTRNSNSNGNESGSGNFVVVVIIVGSLGLPINVGERGDKWKPNLKVSKS